MSNRTSAEQWGGEKDAGNRFAIKPMSEVLFAQRMDEVMAEAHKRYLTQQEKNEQLRALETINTSLKRVADNLHFFLHPYPALEGSELHIATSINLDESDLDLIRETLAKISEIASQGDLTLEQLKELVSWIKSNERVTELITGEGYFSTNSDIQRYISLLLTCSQDTAEGLMSEGGALRVSLGKTNKVKGSESTPDGSKADENRLVQALNRVSLTLVLTTLAAACSPSTVPTQERTETTPTPITLETDKPESTSPKGYVFLPAGTGGTEIRPIPTETTESNKKELEMLQPILISLLNEMQWLEGTQLMGVLSYDNEAQLLKVGATVVTGGSVSGEMTEGSVIILEEGDGQYFLKVENDPQSPIGTVVGTESEFNPELAINEVRAYIDTLNQQLEVGQIILRQNQAAQHEFIYQVDGQENVMGIVGFGSDNTPMITTDVGQSPLEALTINNEGELIIKSQEVEEIEQETESHNEEVGEIEQEYEIGVPNLAETLKTANGYVEPTPPISNGKNTIRILRHPELTENPPITFNPEVTNEQDFTTQVIQAWSFTQSVAIKETSPEASEPHVNAIDWGLMLKYWDELNGEPRLPRANIESESGHKTTEWLIQAFPYAISDFEHITIIEMPARPVENFDFSRDERTILAHDNKPIQVGLLNRGGLGLPSYFSTIVNHRPDGSKELVLIDFNEFYGRDDHWVNTPLTDPTSERELFFVVGRYHFLFQATVNNLFFSCIDLQTYLKFVQQLSLTDASIHINPDYYRLVDNARARTSRLFENIIQPKNPDNRNNYSAYPIQVVTK